MAGLSRKQACQGGAVLCNFRSMNTIEPTASQLRASGDRGVALIAYALLFIAPFFAGIPSLVAVVIAYSRKAEVSRCIRRHHDQQIRMFWVAFALSIIAGPCAVIALITGAGDFIAFTRQGGWSHFGATGFQFRDLGISDAAVLFTVIALGCLTFISVELIVGSVIGFIRLASKSPEQLAR